MSEAKPLRASVIEALRQQGIHTIDDLTSKTEAELLRGPDIGSKSLGEIKAWLERFDLSLASPTNQVKP